MVSYSHPYGVTNMKNYSGKVEASKADGCKVKLDGGDVDFNSDSRFFRWHETLWTSDELDAIVSLAPEKLVIEEPPKLVIWRTVNVWEFEVRAGTRFTHPDLNDVEAFKAGIEALVRADQEKGR